MTKLRKAARGMPCQVRAKWLPIEGYEGLYMVSDNGQVKSLARTINRPPCGRSSKPSTCTYPERILSQKIHKACYPVVCLCKEGRQFDAFVHRLVAKAFVPGSGVVVRHLDGDVLNCHFTNLAWGSFRDNEDDKRRHGRTPIGESHVNAVLTDDLVRMIRVSQKTDLQLSRDLGVARYAVYSARKRITWRHVA